MGAVCAVREGTPIVARGASPVVTNAPPKTRSSLFVSPLGRADAWLIVIAITIAGVVLSKDITVGGLRYGDTAVHAMDGVLIHDWIAAGPRAWMSPMNFAETQYGHYPCLGIGRHYPPAFAVVEAFFFAVFGISPVTARMAVVFFGLLACVGAFLFLRTLADRPTSFLGCVMLMSLPAVTQWGRQVMLEVPTLAALAWGAFTFSWYLSRPSGKRLFVLIIVALSTLAFRQTAVFLPSAVAIALSFAAWRRRVPWRHAGICTVLALLTIVGVLYSFEGAGERMFRGRASYDSLWGLGALTYYLRQLPGEVGWPILLASLVGVVTVRRARLEHGVFLAAWLFVCYVMLCAAELKYARFFFVGLFPFAVWAALAVGRVLAWQRIRPARTVLVAMACAVLTVSAFRQRVEYHPDYGAIVSAHRHKIVNQPVLFGGVRDNHFVFAVRQHLPWRKVVAVRSSKLLYTCNTYPTVDFESRVESPSELRDTMNKYAFPLVITERGNRLGIPQEAALQAYLKDGGDYRLLATHDMRVDETRSHRNTTVDVYELTKPLHRVVKHLDIPIPRSNRNIRVSLADDS